MFFVHVGMGKTGTSSIQYFAKNQNIASKFFHYPTVGLQSDGHHLLALNKNKFKLWRLLVEQALSLGLSRNTIEKPFFISTENLFYESEQTFRHIKSIFDEFSADYRIIISYRKFADYALSTYLEYVSSGRIPFYSSYSFFLNDHLENVRYDTRLTIFEKVFSEKILYYDFDQGRKNGLLSTFFTPWIRDFPRDIDSHCSIHINPSLTKKGSMLVNSFCEYMEKKRNSTQPPFSPENCLTEFIEFSRTVNGLVLNSELIERRFSDKFLALIQHILRVNTPHRILNSNIDSTSLFNDVSRFHSDEELKYDIHNFSTPTEREEQFSNINANAMMIINSK